MPWQSSRELDVLASFYGTDMRSRPQFFDHDSLKEFFGLDSVSAPVRGVLQQFISPKTPSNEVIKAEWTPGICFFERRTNVHKLENNRKVNIYDRSLTYEMDDQDLYTECPFVDEGSLSKRLKETLLTIATHIAQLNNARQLIPCKMVVYFKCGGQDKLWLLWCDELQMKSVDFSRNILNAEEPIKLVIKERWVAGDGVASMDRWMDRQIER